jgi:hypothetical protein
MDDADALEALSARKALLQERLKEIAGVPLSAKEQPPQPAKVDYHWDILLKEAVRKYPISYCSLSRSSLSLSLICGDRL